MKKESDRVQNTFPLLFPQTVLSVFLLPSDLCKVLEYRKRAHFSLGSCFSLYSVLIAELSEMVGTSSWTVLVSFSQSLDFLTFVQHLTFPMSVPLESPLLNLKSLPSLELYEQYLHLKCFLSLLLLAFHPPLNSTDWLSSRFYSPLLGVSFTWPTLLLCLCKGLPFPFQTHVLLSAQHFTYSQWNPLTFPTGFLTSFFVSCIPFSQAPYLRNLIFPTI